MNSAPFRARRFRPVALLFAVLVITACGELTSLLDWRDKGVESDGSPKWSNDEHRANWATWEGAPIDELVKLWGPPSYIDDKNSKPSCAGGKCQEYFWKQERDYALNKKKNDAAANRNTGAAPKTVPNDTTFHCNVTAATYKGIIKDVRVSDDYHEACPHFKPKLPRPPQIGA